MFLGSRQKANWYEALRTAVCWAFELLGCTRAYCYSNASRAAFDELRVEPPDLLLCDLELAIEVLNNVGLKVAAPGASGQPQVAFPVATPIQILEGSSQHGLPV